LEVEFANNIIISGNLYGWRLRKARAAIVAALPQKTADLLR